jgi:MFS family permease
VLFFGVFCLMLSAIVLSMANGVWMLAAGAVIAGVGNSVFHPADYSLLNQKVSHPRLAYAFSVHGLTGNLGWACAPVFLVGIAQIAGWRALCCLPLHYPHWYCACCLLTAKCCKPNRRKKQCRARKAAGWIF